MKIVTLIENLTYKRGLVSEHGLSFYIETAQNKILFDTGQGANFMANALAMGINLLEVDTVVISHGHYDHAGGLYPFLEFNKKAKVYIKKEAFLQKVHKDKSFIGMATKPHLLKNRVEYVNQVTRIGEEVYIMPEIPLKNPRDTHFKNLNINVKGKLEEDNFEDELFLALIHHNELSVISSCSHRGITNILEEAVSRFKLPVNLVLGGFHLKDSRPGQVDEICKYFENLNPKSIGVCHCTGVEKYAALLQVLRSKVFYNSTGNELEI